MVPRGCQRNNAHGGELATFTQILSESVKRAPKNTRGRFNDDAQQRPTPPPSGEDRQRATTAFRDTKRWRRGAVADNVENSDHLCQALNMAMGPGERTPGPIDRITDSLEFDGCSSFFELALRLFGCILGCTFEDGAWCAIDEILGFLQAEVRELTNDLDDLDLLATSVGENDVEVVLFGAGVATATTSCRGSGNSNRSCSGYLKRSSKASRSS